MSSAINGRNGSYQEPAPELNFRAFMASLLGRVMVGEQLARDLDHQ